MLQHFQSNNDQQQQPTSPIQWLLRDEIKTGCASTHHLYKNM
jgi:hypothetical protein